MDFDKLYNAYYMEVYSYVMTLVKNTHLAEEITQESFFKAIKSKNPYKGNASELTWLCAIAKNCCMDEFRKQSRHQEWQDDIPSPADMALAVEDENITLQLHQILHQMEEPYKEVFSLRIFGELSFGKIGQIFGKSETWARVTYHRAKIKMQERMGEHES